MACLVFLESSEPDLALILQAWHSLPEAIEADILAVVRANDDPDT